MSALDKLQSYSSRVGLIKSINFDDTPEGNFLQSVHNSGYSLYEICYKNGSECISEKDYLEKGSPSGYTKELKYTELYNAITSKGDILVNAIAGSGKTSFLLFKIMYDILTGEAMTNVTIPSGMSVSVVNKMWVCTFLKSGATELETSLVSWQNRLGLTHTSSQIVFSTLDAEFKRCLNAMGVAVNIGEQKKLDSLLRKAIDSCNITRLDGSPLTRDDYKFIASIITYCRGRLDNKRYDHPSCKDYGITPTILNLIITQFASLRKAEGIMDFDEVMELLYRYLYITPNKNVQDFVANRYNYIYIDEFQDTSQMQYAILKFYARGRLVLNKVGMDTSNPLFTGEETKGKLAVIGDPSQCIYSFKGSDASIITTNIKDDFHPTILTLSVNWRCPRNILEPIVPSIHMNDSSKSQQIIASKVGGVFKVIEGDDFTNMLESLKTELDEDITNGKNSAILVRTNYEGAIPALFLECSGKYNFSLSGDNMTLSSALPQKLISVARLFTNRNTPSISSALELFIPYGRNYEIKKLVEFCKMNNKTIWTIDEADFEYIAPAVYDAIKNFKNIKNNLSDIEALRTMYYWLKLKFKGSSAYQISLRGYLETLVYVLDLKQPKTVREFLEFIDDISDSLDRRTKKSNTTIKIATVHEFKGKESDSVYVWNDSEGVFPSEKCNLDNDDELEEERRVHYIACTRAKNKEVIFTLKYMRGLFLKEMNYSNSNTINTIVLGKV